MSLLQAIDKTKNVTKFINPHDWNGPNRILKLKPCDTVLKHAGFKEINYTKVLGQFRPEGILKKSYSYDPHRIQTGYKKINVVYNDFDDSVAVEHNSRPSICVEHPLSVNRIEKSTEKYENIYKPIRYIDLFKNMCLHIYNVFTYRSTYKQNTSVQRFITQKPSVKIKSSVSKPSKTIHYPVEQAKNSLTIAVKPPMLNNYYPMVQNHDVMTTKQVITPSITSTKSNLCYKAASIQPQSIKLSTDIIISQQAVKKLPLYELTRVPSLISKNLTEQLTTQGAPSKTMLCYKPIVSNVQTPLKNIDLKPKQAYNLAGTEKSIDAVPHLTDKLKNILKQTDLKCFEKQSTRKTAISTTMCHKTQDKIKILTVCSGKTLNQKPIKIKCKKLPAAIKTEYFNESLKFETPVQLNDSKTKIKYNSLTSSVQLNPHKF
ncbi:hypothetical protein LCDV1gp041 [Lymphocystis disease virus 1]|uniref:hypothetical protein n=1 Tax=Fish lymphocystis disease virus TaxID=36363 RepID=UPI0000161EB3|nr:hypothetical protein LCDV1gp041 [Lymphocystis disease virus 1]